MPQQDCTITSVTLWLTGYTGLEGQFPVVQISGDGTTAPNTHLPVSEIASSTSTPAPNDGSLAGFTFDFPPVTLNANTPYWLEVWQNLSYYSGNNGPSVGFYWATGGNPTGDAVYVGAESQYSYGADPFGLTDSNSRATPAFSIGAVPEPSQLAMMTLSFLCAGGYALCFRRKPAASVRTTRWN